MYRVVFLLRCCGSVTVLASPATRSNADAVCTAAVGIDLL